MRYNLYKSQSLDSFKVSSYSIITYSPILCFNSFFIMLFLHFPIWKQFSLIEKIDTGNEFSAFLYISILHHLLLEAVLSPSSTLLKNTIFYSFYVKWHSNLQTKKKIRNKYILILYFLRYLKYFTFITFYFIKPGIIKKAWVY